VPADFSVEDYRFIRKTIKDIVLMTDMFHHSKLVQSLDSLVAAGPDLTGAALLHTFNANGRAVVLQMIVHAADISNTCRPPEPCGLWAKRVTDGEFLFFYLSPSPCWNALLPS
jgi:cAMP-specific phosphodiesterase 4